MLVVVSPHLDDAVFSCGQLLAAHPGSLVITVFAGRPADGDQSTLHDIACGFANAATACSARRAEDLDAVGDVLACVASHLDFVDYQYGEPRPDADVILNAVGPLVHPGDLLVAPLGYFHHPDHVLVAEACAPLGPQLFYAEQPYAYNASEAFTNPESVGLRRYYPAVGDRDVKREALGRYRSQVNVFDVEDLLRPEVFFAVQR